MEKRWRISSLLINVLLSLIILSALASASLAQSVLTDDAQVSLSQGNANHGTNPNLNAAAAEAIYLKFKLYSTLPAATPGPAVARATLKLYLGGLKTAGKLDLYAVAGAWDESTITANNAPPLGGLVTTSEPIGADQRGRFIVIDITALVRLWLGSDGQGTNGIANHGLALVAHPVDQTTPEAADLTFDSKENAQTSHEPQLNIQLQGSASGLQTVAHDASLTGDGTAASPLGVASGGINTIHLATDAVTTDKIADNAVTTSELADGAVTSAKVKAPLSLTSNDANFTLSAANTGAGAAIMANGAINTTTQYNIGGNRVLSISGGPGDPNSNLFVGVGAGTSNTTGVANSFFGIGAGSQNTDGFLNDFFGRQTGAANTTGNLNTFFGSYAGFQNTTGSENAFFGQGAGFGNTSGSQNSYFGRESGLSNTTGSRNSFFGYDAGRETGREAPGDDNSFFGFTAGNENRTGSSNSFFGRSAGRLTSTGNFNTFLGRDAGFNNTTGSNLTVVGASANVGANNLTNATAIGYRAQVTQSHSLVLGGISGINSGTDTNVGIGTTAPKTKLHVARGKIYVEASGQGVILKSPGGACFELTVTDAGGLVTAPVACP